MEDQRHSRAKFSSDIAECEPTFYSSDNADCVPAFCDAVRYIFLIIALHVPSSIFLM